MKVPREKRKLDHVSRKFSKKCVNAIIRLTDDITFNRATATHNLTLNSAMSN